VKFLIVGIDYFTKWIEAKPLATITTEQVHTRYVTTQEEALIGLSNSGEEISNTWNASHLKFPITYHK